MFFFYLFRARLTVLLVYIIIVFCSLGKQIYSRCCELNFSDKQIKVYIIQCTVASGESRANSPATFNHTMATSDTITVELQWLEHVWNQEKTFETGVFRASGWLVGCFGFNGPLRQYFSLYQAVSQRKGEREEKG